MKKLLRDLFRWQLITLAHLTLWRFRPTIIGVTGSVGKTSTKYAIAAVLSNRYRVRLSQGNFNTEVGLVLAILGDFSEDDLKIIGRAAPAGTTSWQKGMFFVRALSNAFINLFRRKNFYPEILILEYGIDHPGDMKKLLAIARPSVGVVTAIGEIPAHVEFFANSQEVMREKMKLVEQLSPLQYAVINGDDGTIMDARERIRAHVMSFGFSKEVHLRIGGFEHKMKNDQPWGIAFKLEYGGSFVPVRIEGAYGRAQAYAAAAAAGVGLIFGLNLVTISEGLAKYVPTARRMSLVPGINSSSILDDGYNASPLSMLAALDTLASLPAQRKVAVLGDMLEIGKYAAEAHTRVGEAAGECVDVLVTVGRNAAYIADAAHAAGLRKSSIHSFESAKEAREACIKLVKKGDLVLVKGSHAMHLESIVEALKAAQSSS